MPTKPMSAAGTSLLQAPNTYITLLDTVVLTGDLQSSSIFLRHMAGHTEAISALANSHCHPIWPAHPRHL